MSVEILRGDPIAPGFAQGPLRAPMGGPWIPPPGDASRDPDREIDRFRSQVKALEREIEAAVERLESEALGAEADIIRTHLAMLQDPGMHSQILELIQTANHRAETAVEQVLEGMTSFYILDLRDANQFAKEHIPGAVTIEWRQVFSKRDELLRDKPILAYCNTGSFAAQVALALRLDGFDNVKILYGGFDRWKPSGGMNAGK